jgi:hypothetical protein
MPPTMGPIGLVGQFGRVGSSFNVSAAVCRFNFTKRPILVSAIQKHSLTHKYLRQSRGNPRWQRRS